MNATQPSKMPPVVQLLRLIMGKMPTQLIYVAAKLGIADLLTSGPKSIDELAESTNTDSTSLYRVLRALVNMNIFAQNENNQFILTPLAEPLKSDAPDTVRDYAIMCGSDWHNQAWSNLSYSVETGKPAFDGRFNMKIFDFLEQNPEDSAIYHAGISSIDKLHTKLLSMAYDFSDLKTIMDVGGGYGALLADILTANPLLKGILYEQPEVAAEVREIIQKGKFLDRFQIIEGDFFQKVPGGADAYILKLIIHNWNDDICRKILENCRKNMEKNNKLLVIEAIVPKGNKEHIAKLLDIEMLIFTDGGYERTEEEFRALFTSAGFHLNRIIPTLSHLSIIEAQPS
ncbi:MAG: methyltransferase [Promethearchaeota archaeon]